MNMIIFCIFYFFLGGALNAVKEDALLPWETPEKLYDDRVNFLRLAPDTQNIITQDWKNHWKKLFQLEFEERDEWLEHRLLHMRGGSTKSYKFKLERSDGWIYFKNPRWNVDEKKSLDSYNPHQPNAIVRLTNVGKIKLKDTIIVAMDGNENIPFTFTPDLSKILLLGGNDSSRELSYYDRNRNQHIEMTVSSKEIKSDCLGAHGIAFSNDAKKIAFIVRTLQGRNVQNEDGSSCCANVILYRLHVYDYESEQCIYSDAFYEIPLNNDSPAFVRQASPAIESFTFNNSGSKIGIYLMWDNHEKKICKIPLEKKKAQERTCLLQ